MNTLSNGTRVDFQYRQHYLLGGALIKGSGTVIGQTIVGNENAYVINPDNGGDVVHVRNSGVTVA